MNLQVLLRGPVGRLADRSSMLVSRFSHVHDSPVPESRGGVSPDCSWVRGSPDRASPGAPGSPPTGMFSHSGTSFHMEVSPRFAIATPDCLSTFGPRADDAL